MHFTPLHDRVLIRRIEGEDLLIMKESDILGVIQGESAAQKAA